MSSNFKADSWEIDYGRSMTSSFAEHVESLSKYLAEELPYKWRDVYSQHTPAPTQILRVAENGFDYVFDAYSILVERGEVPREGTLEDRLIAVCGRSQVSATRRNSARQRGWIGPTEKHFGRNHDKGHFVAHSLGGGLEINMFMQLRAINRGWSVEGKIYRAMERYCLNNPGTFFFNRPLYGDDSARPAMLEFGILKSMSELWIERFVN